MTYQQLIECCLADTIGEGGLSATSLARLLEAAGQSAEAKKTAKPLADSKDPAIAGDAELLELGADYNLQYTPRDRLTGDQFDSFTPSTTVGSLSARSTGGPIVYNLDVLSGLTTVGGDLEIIGNDALTDVDGLSGLTTVGENLSSRLHDGVYRRSGTPLPRGFPGT